MQLLLIIGHPAWEPRFAAANASTRLPDASASANSRANLFLRLLLRNGSPERDHHAEHQPLLTCDRLPVLNRAHAD